MLVDTSLFLLLYHTAVHILNMLLLLLWPVDKVQDLWVYAASAMAVIMYEHFYIAGILATLPCHVAFRLKWQFTILHFIYVYYFISI